jgi:hypothetical protein
MALPRIDEMSGAHQLYVDAWPLCERGHLISAPGTSATWQGTRTKAAFSPEAEILALVRVEPVYGFTA